MSDQIQESLAQSQHTISQVPVEFKSNCFCDIYNFCSQILTFRCSAVTMQGLRSAPSEVECKDKFLIQSTVVDSGLKEEDVTLELVGILTVFSQNFLC